MDRKITYREIIYQSSEYDQTLLLRHEILRAPWGQSIAEDDLSGEGDDFIYGAFDGGRLVGMATLLNYGETLMRLRYMAVDPAYRGRGIGAHIARTFEAKARETGKEGIFLTARVSVVPFYEKLGYRISGEPFIPDHIAIEHVGMTLLF
ncbi:MAG TPA: GNAT family N-acetyltransferase [Clostridiaceae bacterium]|nr:GNAT family N-acetyltransferase [Clostridiaceae bacterium]